MNIGIFHLFLEDTDTTINGVNVSIKKHITSNSNVAFLEFLGADDFEGLYNIYLDVYTLFFICYGSYPLMLNLSYNDINEDLSEYAPKYFSSKEYIDGECALFVINDNVINKNVIERLKDIKTYALDSLEYLTSENYKHMVINHKITLLSHIVSGFTNPEACYKNNVKNISDKYFFNYTNGISVLDALAMNQDLFISKVADTRNWYSHFFDESKKPNKLKEGYEIAFFISIIFFMLRLLLSEKIGISVSDTIINHHYTCIKFWIIKVKTKILMENGEKI